MRELPAFRLFFAFSIMLIFQCCQNTKLQIPKEIYLKSTPITIPPKLYAQLSSLIIHKNLLISIEPNNDTIFSVFELPKCNFLGSFGINGRGPNEFDHPAASNATSTKTGIVFSDLSDRFFELDLTNYTVNRTFKITCVNLPGEIKLLSNSFILNDSIICGKPYVGGKYNKPFARYNRNSKKIEYFGIWPTLYPTDKEKQNWTIYLGRTRIKPDHSMFAIFMFRIKMLQIYKNSGELFKEVIIETQDNLFDGQWIKPYPITYYTCLRANNSYIYALNQACSGPKLPTNIPTLEIWNWNGEQVANIRLDVSVNQFDITEDGNMMYCSDWNSMDKIYVYDLSVIKN